MLMYVKKAMLSILLAVPLTFFPSADFGDREFVKAECALAAAEEAQNAEAQRPSVTVDADGKLFTYNDDIITPSDFTVEEEISRRRINSALDQKIELVDALIQKGASYKTALLYCFPRLEITVNAVEQYAFVAPVDAEVAYKNGSYYVTKEKTGRAVDENKLYGGLYYSLKFFGGEKTVKASLTPLFPSVYSADLKRDLTLRGAYTTDFSSSTPSRTHNVETAVKKFDGMRIAAGESLSFNALVGERTEENGFKTAKIIVDGKYVDGVGGGACQASTAVYNAAIIAGLDAICNAHSICPSYCPPGLDAMISTASDLVITNNTDKPMYFSVKTGGGKATVKIFGAQREFDIVPEAVVEKTLPHECREIVDKDYRYFDGDAKKGDRMLVAPGKDGYISTTYLKYFKRGKLCKRVKLRTNVYKSSPQIIAIAP